MEKLQNEVKEFNKEHEKKEDFELYTDTCNEFYQKIHNGTSDDAFYGITELFNYGFMNGYNQCQFEFRKVDSLDVAECVDLLRFLNDNLHCVRFSVAEEIVTDVKMIDNALYNVNLSLEKIIDDFDKLLGGKEVF